MCSSDLQPLPAGLGNVGRVEDALPGRPSPLGATPRDGGVNFAVASSVAEAAEVCLFDEAGREDRFRLPDYDGGSWHGFVPGIGPRVLPEGKAVSKYWNTLNAPYPWPWEVWEVRADR